MEGGSKDFESVCVWGVGPGSCCHWQGLWALMWGWQTTWRWGVQLIPCSGGGVMQRTEDPSEVWVTGKGASPRGSLPGSESRHTSEDPPERILPFLSPALVPGSLPPPCPLHLAWGSARRASRALCVQSCYRELINTQRKEQSAQVNPVERVTPSQLQGL